MDDTISRAAAIEAVEFGITYAKAINKETGEITELFAQENKELRKAAERIRQLPSAQPEVAKDTNVPCKDTISRQAAIDILYDFAGCIVDTPNGHYHKAYLAYRHRMEILPSVQQEPQWIPCSERMPEEGSWAIWCSNKGSIQVARWKIDAWDHFFPDQGFFELEDAVAWMPLPEPYMRGEQE